MNCEYVHTTYRVPACLGRRVIIDGEPGIITEDRGNYIGVNFDHDKPGVVLNAHPTWKVEYGEMGRIRVPTRSQQRYKRYLASCECFDSFIAFCRWDASQQKAGEV